MSFKELDIRPVYNFGAQKLLDIFYLPTLKKAVRYDRATGYFRSGILKYLGRSVMGILLHGGKIRIVTGIEFTEGDLEQISKGYKLREVMNNRLMSVVDDVSKDPSTEILTLWWLIKHDYLDIKISVRQNESGQFAQGIYHEKFGILEDANQNKIVFAGSINESPSGWMHNFESFDVFKSWVPGDAERIEIREQNFDTLWNNKAEGIRVVEFPEAVRRRIIDLAPEEMPRVRETDTTTENKPAITLRDYQNEAIESWVQAGYQGIFEMATGSGKTITSLFAANALLSTHPKTIILILCPYTHLVDQWEKESQRAGFEPLKCYQSSSVWKKKLSQKLVDYKIGRLDSFCIISTMDTASSDAFLSLIRHVQDNVLVLADEMHNLGSSKRRDALLSNAPYRLGLSATPHRWMDEEGTQTLFDYFGEVVYTFSLAKAIEYGFLTPYYYHPVPVELTEFEWSDYEELTGKITKLLFSKDPEIKETLERLLLKRAQLANAAVNKVEHLDRLLRQQPNVHHSLIYTSPQMIDRVDRLTKELNLFSSRFTAEESMSDRQTILEMFTAGHLDVLLAMKCLDEGVDVPSIHQAYILASSSNPKEFIQRRGRVLRKSPGKDYSVIYDFIVTPPKGVPISSAARGLIKKELARFKEFGEISENNFQAKLQLAEIAKQYQLLGEI